MSAQESYSDAVTVSIKSYVGPVTMLDIMLGPVDYNTALTERERDPRVRTRFLTWQLWTGFLLCLLAFISYPSFFVRFPVTRDFPWANLLLYCVASAFLVPGYGASSGSRELDAKILGSILAVMSSLVFAFFIFVVFVFGRQLPSSARAPRVGQRAPDFTLTDTNGKSVSLAELISAPLNGKTPTGVLIVFYRGYW